MWLSSVYNQTAVDDDKLQVGGWGDWYRTFIEFDLTNLPQTATFASMHMYAYDRGDSSTPVTMPLYLLITPWSETTQNFYDPLYGYYAGIVSAPTPNSWYNLNITSIYNGWKNGTYANNGFVFLAADNNNKFNVFRSSDYLTDPLLRPKLIITYDGANLGFPLEGYTPYTVPISSVFDHSMITPYATDSVVVAYTGEKGDNIKYGSTDCINQSNGQPFIINGNYTGASSCGGIYYLSYDGHPGFDYVVSTGTPVYATASGTITEIQCPSYPGLCTGFGRIYIDHGNGYSTQYWHLSKQVGSLIVGSNIQKGELIGYSGNTSPFQPMGSHLHFEVHKDNGSSNGLPVDPYGWKGVWGMDPYPINNKDNVCLWDNCQ